MFLTDNKILSGTETFPPEISRKFRLGNVDETASQLCQNRAK
jgi:hypothetical protein